MSQKLTIDPKDPTPIWSQIEEALKRLIANGMLAPGGPVPSTRDLAKDLRINPATVMKAYQRLTEAGVLEMRRGQGTFVSAAPPTMRRTDRAKLLRQSALRYASQAKTLGATRSETATELDGAWDELESHQKGKP